MRALAQVGCGWGECNKANDISTWPGVEEIYIAGADYILTHELTPSCDPLINYTTAEIVPGVELLEDPEQLWNAINGVPFEFHTRISVSDDVDASATGVERDGVEQLTYHVEHLNEQLCDESTPSRVCIVPESDTPVYAGPDSDPSTSFAKWFHTLDVAGANFELRQVREDYTTIVVNDGCWRKVVQNGLQSDPLLANCDPVTGMTGWWPLVDGAQATSTFDYTGFSAACVTGYRALGLTPCGVSLLQPMQMACPNALDHNVWIAYDESTIEVWLPANNTDISQRKNPDTIWYTYPWP
jgi:hypothetical protein